MAEIEAPTEIVADPDTGLDAEDTATLAAMKAADAAPVVAEVDPEPVVEEKSDPAADPAAPKMVDIRALDESRRKLAAAREAGVLKDAELTAARANLAAIMAAQAEAGKFIPDAEAIDADPVAATKQMAAIIQRQNADRAADNRAAQILQMSEPMEAAFAAQVPEYQSAIKYLHDQVVGELVDVSGMDEAGARRAAAHGAAQLIQDALGKGMNPGAMLFRLAQLRGFRPADPAPVAAPAAPAKPDPVAALLAQSTQVLASVQAGQSASRSATAIRGSADVKPTIEDIARLSASDDPADIAIVEAFWKKDARRAFA